MVRGKPTLTFGEGQRAATAQMRDQDFQRVKKQTTGKTGTPGFASFLPGPGKGNANPVPLAQRPVSGPGGYDYFNHDMLLPLKSAAQQKQAASELVTVKSRAKTQPLALPSGLAEARAAEKNLTRSMRKKSAVFPEEQEGRRSFSGGPSVNSRKGERISGRPVTGRNAFGMEDTRHDDKRTAARRSPSPAPARSEQQGVTDTQLRQFARQNQGSLAKAAAFDGYSLHNPGFGLAAPPSKTPAVKQPQTFGKVLESASQPSQAQTLSSAQVEAALAARRQAYFSPQDEDAIMSVRSASHRRKAAKEPRADQGAGTAVAERIKTVPQRDSHARKTGQAAAYGGAAGKTMSAALKDMALDTGAGKPMGFLAAKFESGAEGIAAIGYDRHGGTSYGKFQLSSRAGTMHNFISYLREKAPHMAKQLASAGPANTGGRKGKMPDVWRSIATSEPQRFEQLQNDFIKNSHFEPAMQAIAQNTGVAFEQMPSALKEVLFSTAVQHGVSGATRIFSRAVQRVGSGRLQNKEGMPEGFKRAGRDLIKQIYAIRAGQFVSSTARVQASVRNRLSREMNEALSMLA